ncbi:tyrosinase family oxidase copper chaperone [Actinoplanes sp. NPDC051861]|uniref:tyrosinase family oxidase copper chaperone n=1 Tax=Actinoplanes sp. NPDC051861 TaxID=3155170 RepID=UPI0034489F97
MISMQRKSNARRSIAVLVTAAGLLVTAGSASAADPAPAPVSAPPPAPDKGFYQQYRGHHIMGWGEGESACAYIDGVRLVLYSDGDGWYRSALQGFQKERGVKAVTKASVKTLGKEKMASSGEFVSNCPEFAPAKTTVKTVKPAKPMKPAKPVKPAKN